MITLVDPADDDRGEADEELATLLHPGVAVLAPPPGTFQQIRRRAARRRLLRAVTTVGAGAAVTATAIVIVVWPRGAEPGPGPVSPLGPPPAVRTDISPLIPPPAGRTARTPSASPAMPPPLPSPDASGSPEAPGTGTSTTAHAGASVPRTGTPRLPVPTSQQAMDHPPTPLVPSANRATAVASSTGR